MPTDPQHASTLPDGPHLALWDDPPFWSIGCRVMVDDDGPYAVLVTKYEADTDLHMFGLDNGRWYFEDELSTATS